MNLHIENPLILVVEDDRDTLELMTSALSTDGLSCVPAVSVAEAIAAVKQNKITLVVLDWGLDRNGGEVLQATRALYPGMPVIVVSGRPYDVRTDAIVGQADAFLHKPFSATVLRNQVAQLLERSERARKTLYPQRLDDILKIGEVKALYIQHVVHLLNNNISLAAEKLGIHRQTVASVLRRADAIEHHS